MTGNKINWQDLAADLATRAGMPRKEAETFVRTFFDTLGKSILEEKSVKIKALGTFKMVEVQDRESVNVNTGERFTISGHSKIGFLPDNALKELVNKPFADFQTVILNEGTTAEEMEQIDRKYPSTGSEEAESAAPPTQGDDEEVPESTPDTGGEPDAPAEEAVQAPSPAETDEEETENPLPLAADEEPTPAEPEAPAIPSTTEKDEEEEALPEHLDSSKEIPAAEPVPAEPASEEAPVAEEAPDEPIQEESAPMPQQQEGNAPAQNNTSSTQAEVAQVPHASRSGEAGMTLPPRHNVWRTLFLTLVGLLLMVICYMAGYLRLINMSWLCMPPAEEPSEIPVQMPVEEPGTPSVEQADSKRETQATDNAGTKETEGQVEKKEDAKEPKDSPKPSATTSVQEDKPQTQTQEKTRQDERSKQLQAAKNFPQVNGGKYLITGVRKTRVMQHGENLYRMARQEYGDKSIVEYIKVLNHFENPDNIPAGYEVKLPQLLEKGE